jgi:hypothetical protein
MIVTNAALTQAAAAAGEPAFGGSRSTASDARLGLERRWANATAEVIHAQRDYATLISHGAAEDKIIDAAWLRLWRAQEHQRELSSELDLLEI